jgi:hypothetical protein
MKKKPCSNPNCEEMIEVPDDFKYEFCCNGRECGCYGYPINPVFCDPCEQILFKSPITK